jgi:hypothetical protein
MHRFAPRDALPPPRRAREFTRQHHLPGRDSEPARLLRDDAFGTFFLPMDPRGFRDGGDGNDDGLRQTTETMPDKPTDVLLVAKGSLATLVPGNPGVEVGERALDDLIGAGTFDVGEGLVLNFFEPFADGNNNGRFEPERRGTCRLRPPMTTARTGPPATTTRSPSATA